METTKYHERTQSKPTTLDWQTQHERASESCIEKYIVFEHITDLIITPSGQPNICLIWIVMISRRMREKTHSSDGPLEYSFRLVEGWGDLQISVIYWNIECLFDIFLGWEYSRTFQCQYIACFLHDIHFDIFSFGWFIFHALINHDFMFESSRCLE